MIRVSFHQEMHFLGIFRGEGFIHDLSGRAYIGSMADVGDDDMFVLHLRDQFGQVVEVIMFSGSSPFAVVLFKEGTFGDQDFAFSDTREFFEVAACGIPKVSDQGDIERVSDLVTVFSQLSDFVTGQLFEFGF